MKTEPKWSDTFEPLHGYGENMFGYVFCRQLFIHLFVCREKSKPAVPQVHNSLYKNGHFYRNYPIEPCFNFFL